MADYFKSLFGSAPSLSDVSVMPGMDMGQLGTSVVGMTPTTEMLPIAQGSDFMKMLSMAGGLAGQQQQPRPMMPAVPAPHLQAGGGQFTAPYQPMQPYQPRPTSQALSGLLGGIYGNL